MRAVESRLRERLRALELERDELVADRFKFREFIVAELRRQLEVLGKGQYYGPQAMIERITKHMQSVKHWWWA